MSGAILITGASSGIGHATAEMFLKKGWTVGALARRAEALEELTRGRDNVVALPADVTDPDAVENAFARFLRTAGRFDVLFNNAGIFGVAAPIDEVPVDTWMNVVNVNLNGMFLCARQAFSAMRSQQPQGGRIINNGSISAHVPRDGSVWRSGNCGDAVRRGGSWVFGPGDLRSAYRSRNGRGDRGRFRSNGFRVARTLSGQ